MEGQIPRNVIECMNCCSYSLMMYDIVYPREVYFMIGNPIRKAMNNTSRNLIWKDKYLGKCVSECIAANTFYDVRYSLS